MEIEFFGHNAIKIKQGSESIGFDLEAVNGGKKVASALKDVKAVFFTDESKANAGVPEGVHSFQMPGEYEIGPFSVRGVAVEAQGDVYGTKTSNVYLVDPGGDFGLVGIIAYAKPELNSEALDLLANARLIIVPAGGAGLSLEPEDALKVVKELNAEFVVPVHFDDGETKYEVPQVSYTEFAKLCGSEPEVFEGKLVTKKLVSGADGVKVVVIKPA
jgi:L-ascorbate metabolism protein UlaG (beta-lactamase superfamily)